MTLLPYLENIKIHRLCLPFLQSLCYLSPPSSGIRGQPGLFSYNIRKEKSIHVSLPTLITSCLTRSLLLSNIYPFLYFVHLCIHVPSLLFFTALADSSLVLFPCRLFLLSLFKCLVFSLQAPFHCAHANNTYSILCFNQRTIRLDMQQLRML